MSVITRVHAREIYDSRGKPTVEVEVYCGKKFGRGMVPSGASTGQYEAHELRDGNPKRFRGQGVQRAVLNVITEIAGALVGEDVFDQRRIDRKLCELDGTPNKSRLGANAILGTSLAVAEAAAAVKEVPIEEHFHQLWIEEVGAENAPRSMPMPMVNMISGGLHAGGNLDFQDFLALPVGATSYHEAFEWIVGIYRRLGMMLQRSGFEGHLVGDEGGYGPRLKSLEQAAEFVIAAIEAEGLEPGKQVALGLDVAATHFYSFGKYCLRATGERALSSEEMVDLLASWCNVFPIVSIEDGLAESDWEGWRLLTKKLGDKVQLLGDDLFVTNPARLQEGIDKKVGNSVLIKLNQIGSLSETLKTLALAKKNNYAAVVSARSGETEDHTIADLVVATGAGQLKVGSVARSERLAKYNQLLRLEERFEGAISFAGREVLGRTRN